MSWIEVDLKNPPATHIVALYNDGSGAVCLTKFDNSGYLHSEDGWEFDDTTLAGLGMWAPAPENWRPFFMEMTIDE